MGLPIEEFGSVRPRRFALNQLPNGLVFESGISKLDSECVKAFACNTVNRWLDVDIHQVLAIALLVISETQ
jgi:hypothetical protein